MHIYIVNVVYNDGTASMGFTCSAYSEHELVADMYSLNPGSIEIITTHGRIYVIEIANVRFVEVYQNDPQG